jgi:hypothetical protein
MADMAVTYIYPVTATPTTPPTALQMSKRVQVVAEIACGGVATNDPTDVIHNLGVSIDGSDGQPVITPSLVVQGATAQMPTITFIDANTVRVTQFLAGAASGFTLRLVLERRK